jgi:DNA-binding NarL/FixJ family response regulator
MSKIVIRVLAADDHPIIREAVRKLLELENGIEMVGEAADGQETLELISQLEPDVVLLGLRMPGMDGFAVLQALKQSGRHAKVIAFTAVEDTNEWVRAMKLGCAGIVAKRTATEFIVKSIRKVHEGEIWLDAYTTAAVMGQSVKQQRTSSPTVQGEDQGGTRLSSRERELVVLVAEGYRNREIAEKLFISERTVKNHLRNIFDKLGVSDRLELALYAIHNGLHTLQSGP